MASLFCVGYFYSFTLVFGIVCVLSHLVMSDSSWPHKIVAHQAPLSMEFSKQEYWGGLPFPSPGDLPEPGIEPESPVTPALVGRFFTTWATWELLILYSYFIPSPITSLVAQMVKNRLAMRETWVWSLGGEDSLEEGMATHSSIPA